MVGNASPGFAGVTLGYQGLSRATLISAIACWFAFQPIILYRMIFAEPRSAVRALPGFDILVSAPAVIAIALSAILGTATRYRCSGLLFAFLCAAQSKSWQTLMEGQFLTFMVGSHFSVNHTVRCAYQARSDAPGCISCDARGGLSGPCNRCSGDCCSRRFVAWATAALAGDKAAVGDHVVQPANTLS